MRTAEASRMKPGPYLVFGQSARNELSVPQTFGRTSIFSQQLRQRDGGFDVDHRSARSRSSSSRMVASRATGCRGTLPPGPISGGVNHPPRTNSASTASSTAWLRPCVGGISSATTRSRSVINTVSPPAARRTYSLSLFLRTLSPTALTGWKVAPGSHHVKGGVAIVSTSVTLSNGACLMEQRPLTQTATAAARCGGQSTRDAD